MTQLSSNRALMNSAILAGLALITLASGCATIAPLSGQALPAEQQELAAKRGTYSVEMHSVVGKPKQYKGVLTGSTTVSEALSAAGAVKKHNSLDIEVLRIVAHKGVNRGLRMPVDYNPRTRAPSPEQDYALLDGDRIVVKPKQSGGLTKMLGAIAGQ